MNQVIANKQVNIISVLRVISSQYMIENDTPIRAHHVAFIINQARPLISHFDTKKIMNLISICFVQFFFFFFFFSVYKSPHKLFTFANNELNITLLTRICIQWVDIMAINIVPKIPTSQPEFRKASGIANIPVPILPFNK